MTSLLVLVMTSLLAAPQHTAGAALNGQVLAQSAAQIAGEPTASLAPTVEQLQARLAAQQRRIDQLEAKVGLPGSAISWTWFMLGLLGEFVFFMRFVVQWYASERKGRTVVPMAFWHLSLAGTAMVLAYAIYIFNWVFILAYGLNIFLYVRNLVIARRTPAAAVVMEKESE